MKTAADQRAILRTVKESSPSNGQAAKEPKEPVQKRMAAMQAYGYRSVAVAIAAPGSRCKCFFFSSPLSVSLAGAQRNGR